MKNPVNAFIVALSICVWGYGVYNISHWFGDASDKKTACGTVVYISTYGDNGNENRVGTYLTMNWDSTAYPNDLGHSQVNDVISVESGTWHKAYTGQRLCFNYEACDLSNFDILPYEGQSIVLSAMISIIWFILAFALDKDDRIS